MLTFEALKGGYVCRYWYLISCTVSEDVSPATTLFKRAHELNDIDASYTYAQLLRLGMNSLSMYGAVV